MRAGPRWANRVTLVAFFASLTGCSDDIVYRDVTKWEPPPEGAADFLGYSSLDAKRTVCGNCHAGKQAAWEQTKHADAWAAIADVANQAACQGCHAVTSLGNVLEDENVGYVATKNSRYYDVQCESCHGPGLTHATNPDLLNTKPLAPLKVAVDLKRGCGECHTGAHNPFLEEWAASNHNMKRSISRYSNPECMGCHEATGILAKWGVKSVYLEAPSVDTMSVTCTVCHDPHDATNPKQLRFPVTTRSLETNLCMKCHQRRAYAPDTNSTRGPHSPQGPILLGLAGYRPPNFAYAPGELVSTHGSEKNEKLCAGCHMASYEIPEADGAFKFRATGHSFNPIPCVGADGIPTGTNDCAETERSFRACVGCHLSEEGARTAFTVASERLTRLADEITALLTQVPSTAFNIRDNWVSPAEGVRFNRDMARMAGSAAHNPFYMEALLLASIEYLRTEYGLAPSPALDMKAQLAPR